MDLILDRFITLRAEMRDWDEKTLSNNKHILGKFDSWLRAEGLDFATLDEEDFLRYWKKLKTEYAVATANQHLIRIRAAYSWALRKKGIQVEGDPTMEVRMLKDDTFKDAAEYTAADLRAIHNAIQTTVEELGFHLLTYTGLRREEIVELKWENVEWENDILNVFGKGRKWRRVPIHPLLREVLESHYDDDQVYVVNSAWGTRMSVKTFNEKMAKLLDRAGVHRFARPLHAFRSTFNNNLHRELGENHKLTIKRIMGHTKTEDVNEAAYRAVRDDEMHKAILALYKSDPIRKKEISYA